MRINSRLGPLIFVDRQNNLNMYCKQIFPDHEYH
jgi:hypothetical protein